MALIECKKCGNSVSDKATLCPHCGAKVVIDIICQECGNVYDVNEDCCPNCGRKNHIIEEKSKKRPFYASLIQAKVLKRAVFALILIGIAFGGYSFYDWHAEKALWNKIQESEDLSDYREYMDKYPDGPHFIAVEDLYDELKEAQSEWREIEESSDIYEFKEYLRKNLPSKFKSMAESRLDSLAWLDAINMDTPDGYADYLDLLPKVKHKEEAEKRKRAAEERIRLEKLRTLTGEEESHVCGILYDFINGVQHQDLDESVKHFPNSFTFQEKSATKVNVITYIKNLHAEDVYNVNLNLSDIIVTKRIIDNKEPVYDASFSVDIHRSREDASKETFSSNSGIAIINKDWKITSLSLRKISSY